MQVAIDGPAGAGKSTVAQILAKKLNLVYIDTGAMYRALTWKALHMCIPLDNTDKLCELTIQTEIHFEPFESQQKVFCDGIDISEHIRTPEINNNVSILASHTKLRAIMVKKQQQMAEHRSVVMDGRDVGECILPQADYKFFLTASLEDRSFRRFQEMKQKGMEAELETVCMLLRQRDEDDSKRKTGALKVLHDSIVLDTSTMNVEQVVELLLSFMGVNNNAVPVG